MDMTSGSLFSYVDLEERIPARHPLRKIRQVVNDALASLDADFEALYIDFGRPSIPPERLIRGRVPAGGISVRWRSRSSKVDPVNIDVPHTGCGTLGFPAHF